MRVEIVLGRRFLGCRPNPEILQAKVMQNFIDVSRVRVEKC